MQQIIFQNSDFFIKLLLAMILGMSIGIERYIHHKTAGMRTYALVSMGSALFIIISQLVGTMNFANFNPTMMAANIITGIGFLGAGLIIMQDSKLSGLTTASGLWVAAGIGTAVGFGLYSIAMMTTVLTIFVFAVLYVVEERIRKMEEKKENKISNN